MKVVLKVRTEVSRILWTTSSSDSHLQGCEEGEVAGWMLGGALVGQDGVKGAHRGQSHALESIQLPEEMWVGG